MLRALAADLPSRMILELLRSGEPVRFRARGRSMWPAIPSGSRVEVEPCLGTELEVGQIAAFEREGKVVVHRVERITAHGVVFAGDSLEAGDGCIAFPQVLGRARVLQRRRLNWRWPRLEELRWLRRAVQRWLRPRRQ